MSSHLNTAAVENHNGAVENQTLGAQVPAEQRLPRRKVWIDLENSPHVPFFLPIISALEKHECDVVLSARDCFQVCELADLADLKYVKIGRHYGKNRLAKLVGLGIRVMELAPLVLRNRPSICISHGSRSLIVLSAILRIPSITLMDYEHADLRLIRWLGSKYKTWIMTPEAIPPETFIKQGMLETHVLQYPGIKEDVYVPFFQPDPSLADVLGLSANDVIVTIRPPATEAHYHNPESEKLLRAVLDLLGEHSEVKTILLPRTSHQEVEIRREKPELFAQGRIIVPKRAVDGLDLIWYSDLVISGGGTMNREAAALDVPVYSLFRGKLGAVDRDLSRRGKLVLLQSDQDVREKLKLVRRSKTNVFAPGERSALNAILQQIGTVLKSCN
jgi:hypothetical protein